MIRLRQPDGGITDLPAHLEPALLRVITDPAVRERIIDELDGTTLSLLSELDELGSARFSALNDRLWRPDIKEPGAAARYLLRLERSLLAHSSLDGDDPLLTTWERLPGADLAAAASLSLAAAAEAVRGSLPWFSAAR